MERMEIVVQGVPVAKKRPRFSRVGKGVRTYSDQQTEEGRFLLLCRQAINAKIEGPVKLVCVFFMPRPKGHFGTGRNVDQLKPSAPPHHTKKPDVDNLVKFVKDCLNGFAWRDDSQVVEVIARKIYAREPRTELIISGV